MMLVLATRSSPQQVYGGRGCSSTTRRSPRRSPPLMASPCRPSCDSGCASRAVTCTRSSSSAPRTAPPSRPSAERPPGRPAARGGAGLPARADRVHEPQVGGAAVRRLPLLALACSPGRLRPAGFLSRAGPVPPALLREPRRTGHPVRGSDGPGGTVGQPAALYRAAAGRLDRQRRVRPQRPGPVRAQLRPGRHARRPGRAGTHLPVRGAKVTRVPSDEPGTRRYERIGEVRPGVGFTGTRFYLFPGGCVTYQFQFDGEERPGRSARSPCRSASSPETRCATLSGRPAVGADLGTSSS